MMRFLGGGLPRPNASIVTREIINHLIYYNIVRSRDIRSERASRQVEIDMRTLEIFFRLRDQILWYALSWSVRRTSHSKYSHIYSHICRIDLLLAHNLGHARANLFPGRRLVQSIVYGLAIIVLFPALYLLSYNYCFMSTESCMLLNCVVFSLCLTILKVSKCIFLSLLCLFLEITKTLAGGPVTQYIELINTWNFPAQPGNLTVSQVMGPLTGSRKFLHKSPERYFSVKQPLKYPKFFPI